MEPIQTDGFARVLWRNANVQGDGAPYFRLIPSLWMALNLARGPWNGGPLRTCAELVLDGQT